MKIACYCQHVLGIGHFHRSLTICEELVRKHETVMLLGGPEVPLPETDVNFITLPGLQMDATFSHLLPCLPGADLEQIKRERRHQLFHFMEDFQPDVFLVELYPFGRKAFTFELEPLLQAMGDGTLASCLRICSLRDILVEKTTKDKYEERALTILNSLFDGLLVHSDPDFIPLQKTFSRIDDITVPLHYTGFISRQGKHPAQGKQLRQKLQLAATDRLIIVSIGGGSVGTELLHAAADAANLLSMSHSRLHFHLFCGPYSDPILEHDLRKKGGRNVIIHSFSNTFPDWLAAADLSISMAGYNTCMNILHSGVPALLYPFAQNHEQQMRIAAFSDTAPLAMLQPEDLVTEKLSNRIAKMLQFARQQITVNLDGARETAALLDNFLT